jgi:putative flippase GtrA
MRLSGGAQQEGRGMALNPDFGLSLGQQPTRAPDGLSYGAIAAIALLAHMTCLWLVCDVCGGTLGPAQAIAALAAAATVYAIEEILSLRVRGPWRWYLGLLPFFASSGFGITCSVLLAILVERLGADWFVAGLLGALFGLWWNQGAVDRHGWPASR